jgi:SAM-dependent methyltransferase
MTTEKRANAAIWDDIYSGGRLLWYPYEVAVRIVNYLNRQGRLVGRILDHGCGTGNHLEFFVRLGLDAVGTEVAPAACEIVKNRFGGAKLKAPEVVVFDPERPLAGQLPRYDHVFAWGSTHYGRREKVLSDIAELAQGLAAGGSFIFAAPSLNDVVARHSVRESDGTYCLVDDVSGQEGALISIPQDEDELCEWCPGVEIEDIGRFGWTLRGETSEFIFLYGRKSGRS